MSIRVGPSDERRRDGRRYRTPGHYPWRGRQELALAYYSLGPEARKHADWYIHDYYGWLGDYADQIAGSVATSEEMVKSYVSAFEDAGCDELVLFPCSTDLEQVDLLAGALDLGRGRNAP